MLTEISEHCYYDGHKTLMAKCPNGYNYQGERYRGDVLLMVITRVTIARSNKKGGSVLQGGKRRTK